MDNQHKKISGYRDLSQGEIDLMNQIKAKETEVLILVKELEEAKFAKMNAEKPDPRWVAIGKTDIQTGFMALVRSIAKPGNII